MRQKIVAGNWKMNNDLPQSISLLSSLVSKELHNEVKVMVAPAFPLLYPAKEIVKESNIEVIAQNINENKNGAFTGEVAASMLKSIGVTTVIIGHSERRAIYNETYSVLAKKVEAALAQNFRVIFCVGEELDARKKNEHFSVVENQLAESLFQISENDMKNVVIAYEPVWAIGTGETATPAEAQEMHAFIRTKIADKYNNAVAESISILYGGSVKPDNAQEIFSQPDVDGGLIGGASLNADDFTAIINAF